VVVEVALGLSVFRVVFVETGLHARVVYCGTAAVVRVVELRAHRCLTGAPDAAMTLVAAGGGHRLQLAVHAALARVRAGGAVDEAAADAAGGVCTEDVALLVALDDAVAADGDGGEWG
jgi:hypothetical protein